MAITPAYFLALELKYLAATVNASACWRALVAQPDYTLGNLFTLADAGTSSEANGLAAIKRGVADAVTYPHCQVCRLLDDQGAKLDLSSLRGESPLLVQIEHTIPTDYDDDIEEAQVYWDEVVGRLVTEFIRANDSAGYLDWGRASIACGIEPPDDRPEGRTIGVAKIVVYANREVY